MAGYGGKSSEFLAARDSCRAPGRRLPGRRPRGRAKPPKASYKPGESVLLRYCSGIASALFPYASLVLPLYYPCTTLILPLYLLCHSRGSTAPPPGRWGQLARDNHGELRWKRISPAIYLLPGPNKDARTRREVAEFLKVQLGEVAGASVRSRQQAEEAEVPPNPSACGARGRRENQGMPGGHLEHTEQEAEPIPTVADHQRPQPIQAKRRTLGRAQKWREAEETLVGIYLGKKVLPGEATTWAPVTTPFFLLGGFLPGSILGLSEIPPPARGAPKSSPGVALRGAAALAVVCAVTCFHRVMSFQFAAGWADGLVAEACNADKTLALDMAAINSLRQPTCCPVT